MKKIKSGMAILIPASLAFSACSGGVEESDRQQINAEAYADALNEATFERNEADIACGQSKPSRSECTQHIRKADEAMQTADSIMNQEIRDNYDVPRPM